MDKSKWEYKKLGEVCTKASSNIVLNKIKDSDGDYPLYGANGFVKNIDFYHQPNEYIGIVKDGSGVGRVNIYPSKSSLVGTMQYILPTGEVTLSYLKYFLQSKNLGRYASGAAIPHIYFKDYSKELIPVLPTKVQNHIVSELDQLSAIISFKQQQMKEYDALAQSLFYEMFGDPVSNSKEWKEEPLEKIGLLARGVSKHRPRNDKSLLGGTMPLIQTGDIANCGLYLTKYFQTYSELGIAQSKVWPRGTLCITIAANIGKAAILNFDACFPDSVVGFLPNKDKTNNIYMYYVFGQLQKILEENAPSVAQKNINLRILNSTNIPLPPLSLQRSFAEKVKAIEHQKSLLKQSIAETQTLLDSRMQEYFG